ncbi:MAG TPA: hypothetical protein VHL98_07250 [Microvirga sp.]|jgi:hypothetical protein|nr:hypothetical protein [Microvirga sp.]
MKNSAWLAVVLIGSGLAAASPSLAQSRYGSGSYDYDYSDRVSRDRYDGRYIERRDYRDDDYVTGSVDTCRTVVTQREKRNGSIVTKRVRSC